MGIHRQSDIGLHNPFTTSTHLLLQRDFFKLQELIDWNVFSFRHDLTNPAFTHIFVNILYLWD
jgi:hypothetical protein